MRVSCWSEGRRYRPAPGASAIRPPLTFLLLAGPRPARPPHAPRQPADRSRTDLEQGIPPLAPGGSATRLPAAHSTSTGRPVADRPRAGRSHPSAPGGSATRPPTARPASTTPTGRGPVLSERETPFRSRRVRDPPARHTPRANHADRSRTGLSIFARHGPIDFRPKWSTPRDGAGEIPAEKWIDGTRFVKIDLRVRYAPPLPSDESLEP